MFSKEIYIKRRSQLVKKMKNMGESGILLFLGNIEVPSHGCLDCSSYKFRQDSSFLYYFGVDSPRWAGIIDIDSGDVTAYADELTLEDLIWTGNQPSVIDQAANMGITSCKPYKSWDADVKTAMSQGRRVHFLPASRADSVLHLSEATGYPSALIKKSAASSAFINAVVSQRLVKEKCEIEELHWSVSLGYMMHETGRALIRVGAYESDIYSRMTEIAERLGWGTAFRMILTQHGEYLHNNEIHYTRIEPGKLLLIDGGVESSINHYASDLTRTYPTSGKFTTKQREIYEIVYRCNELAFELTAPGREYKEIHLAVARKMLEDLSALGLVHGDIDEMVAAGIAGLFMPHGLGHCMGLDSHDMEDLGEDVVGYDPGQERSSQLGLGNLRFARRLVPGHVITDEPGIYFIPALIEKFKKEGLGYDFVNYSKLESYYDFGGIRLEDDVLVTRQGACHLGNRLPIAPDDVEEAMSRMWY